MPLGRQLGSTWLQLGPNLASICFQLGFNLALTWLQHSHETRHAEIKPAVGAQPPIGLCDLSNNILLHSYLYIRHIDFRRTVSDDLRRVGTREAYKIFCRFPIDFL